jgi:hypothetical protein
VNTVVQTSFGDVEVHAKSLAILFSSNKGLAVFNLDDQHRDAVKINVSGKTIHVSPGKHVAITYSSVKGFEQINPIEEIGYRSLSEKPISSELKVFSGEFSIPSAIGSIDALKRILSSKNTAELKLSAHLRKTIAAMLQMNRGTEPFHQITRTQISAYKQ